MFSAGLFHMRVQLSIPDWAYTVNSEAIVVFHRLLRHVLDISDTFVKIKTKSTFRTRNPPS